MAILPTRIYTGRVVQFFFTRNFGFVRSTEEGGFEMFFHMDDRHSAVTRDGTVKFSLSNPRKGGDDWKPIIGDNLVFKVSTLFGRPRADPWTLESEWREAIPEIQLEPSPITGAIITFNQERRFGFARVLTDGPFKDMEAFIHYEDWRPPLISPGSVTFSTLWQNLGIGNAPSAQDQIVFLPGHPPKGLRAIHWCKAPQWHTAEEKAGIPQDQRLPRY